MNGARTGKLTALLLAAAYHPDRPGQQQRHRQRQQQTAEEEHSNKLAWRARTISMLVVINLSPEQQLLFTEN